MQQCILHLSSGRAMSSKKVISIIHALLFHQMISYTFFLSVQFSRSVVSDSLRPHEPQHTRPPCPSPTPGVNPNPCPLSRWCLCRLILCRTLLLLLSIFPSIRVFSNESALCIRWPKNGSFSFYISPSNGHPGLTSSNFPFPKTSRIILGEGLYHPILLIFPFSSLTGIIILEVYTWNLSMFIA